MPVGALKALKRCPVVMIKAFYRMGCPLLISGSAAIKKCFRLENSGLYGVSFEKLNWQKWQGCNVINSLSRIIQEPCKLLVRWIMLKLIVE